MTTTINIDRAELALRHERNRANGGGKAAWVRFCHDMLDLGMQVQLHDDRTFTKHLTVIDGLRSCPVRFGFGQVEVNGAVVDPEEAVGKVMEALGYIAT